MLPLSPQRHGGRREWVYPGIAPVRRDVARLQELAAVHIVHAVTPSGVACNVVLFSLAVSLRDERWLR
ncbi:MAG TPA: hypothetical protein DEF43_20440 [Chloroflexus aurantiacus]|nr:MAG: hypothetical protein D6716_09460 [Chloroflexota bacterium]HBW69471.1 hypothetical protein [Chloroflexus aurantiacus]